MIVLPAPGSSASRNRSGGPRQQLAVDGLDLVRQRLQVAGGHGQHRVEPARHLDPDGLSGQPVRGGVTVESRLVVGLDDPQT